MKYIVIMDDSFAFWLIRDFFFFFFSVNDLLLFFFDNQICYCSVSKERYLLLFREGGHQQHI